MVRVMFVCHGNICRSPMAEFIFKKIIKDHGREDDFLIASSATSGEEIYRGVGNPIYPPAKKELLRRGVPFEDHRATRLVAADYEKYDYFLCMDDYNMQNMLSIFKEDPDGKCRLLLSFTKKGGRVADPWYSGDFQGAFDDIYAGCTAFFEYILKMEEEK